MSICNGFHPTHQAQLTFKYGGKYGGVNCTACSGGMAGESDTCGALLFTGAQVRAATNEPVPDPQSPGLNLSQVHAALFSLSKGKIDLDVRYGLAFDALKVRVTGGAQAILQGARKALIDAGQGYGNGFAGGHAIAIGADNGVPWFDDPLTKRAPTTWATLEKFAGSLDTGDHLLGIGKAYAAFTRDITATYRATCRPIKPAKFRKFTRYIVVAARITGHETRLTKGFQLPCSAPANIPTKANASVKVSLVQLHKPGTSMDGWWVGSQFAEVIP